MKKRYLAGTALLLAGCGYVGDPLPPALRRPMAVRDLAAVERGDRIIIQFTLPKLTTEGLELRGDEDIELRAGTVEGTTFDSNQWLGSSERIAVRPEEGAVRADLDARRYAGRMLVIGARIHGPKGRDAGWSNFVVLPVVAPLATPANFKAADGPDSIHLTWQAPGGEFHIFRRVAGTSAWLYQGNSVELGFSDPAIEFGTQYEYFVQAVRKVDDNRFAESDLSDVVSFTATDRFPPAIPSGVSAAPGVKTVELVWDRNTERDLAFYRVYRDGVKIADNVTQASFSDETVEAGKTYRYQVSAVDTAGNESGQSAAIEAGVS
jgi:hypothetical protein